MFRLPTLARPQVQFCEGPRERGVRRDLRDPRIPVLRAPSGGSGVANWSKIGFVVDFATCYLAVILTAVFKGL